MIAANTQEYGYLSVYGSIRCRETTKRMQEQNLLNHVSQPMNQKTCVSGNFLVRFVHKIVPSQF